MPGKTGVGQLRVIAGALRGRRIGTLPGESIRPTGDRVREALFDILGNRIVGAAFLDVYAGTGAIGIEALSRGALAVTFIEKHPAAVELIQQNLLLIGEYSSSAHVMAQDVAQAVAILEFEARHFDFIYLDPPYKGAELERGLRLIAEGRLPGPSGIVIAEHDAHENPPACPPLTAYRTVRYGRAALTFHRLDPAR